MAKFTIVTPAGASFTTAGGGYDLEMEALENLDAEIVEGPANEVGFMTTAFAMVSAGLGVTTCLPYASSLIRLHQLQSRTLSSPLVRRKFLVFTRRDRPLSPAAQRFSEYLGDYVTRQEWCTTAR